MEKYTENERRMIMDVVKERPGCRMSTISEKTGIEYSRASKIMRTIFDSGLVQRTGNRSSVRWYPLNYDRRTHNEFDNIPIVVRKKTKTKSAIESKERDLNSKVVSKEIPNDIYTIDLKAEDVGLEERKELQPEINTTVEINVDEVLSAIDVLRGIRTGTEADALIEQAVGVLESRLDDAVRACPFCGKKSKVVRSSSNEYRIECSCGFRFANINTVRSATETVKAYNQRVLV